MHPVRYPRATLLLAASFLSACSVSQDQEVAIGKQNAAEVNASLPLIRDVAVVEYVRELGMAMAKTTTRADLDWQFFVVDSKEVNAFALPGGFIYVNRGLGTVGAPVRLGVPPEISLLVLRRA